MKRHFYTITDHLDVIDNGLVTVKKGRYINGNPIEDYGMYILSIEPIDDPLNDYIEHI